MSLKVGLSNLPTLHVNIVPMSSGWLAGWLVGWLAGSLAGWMAGWLNRCNESDYGKWKFVFPDNLSVIHLIVINIESLGDSSKDDFGKPSPNSQMCRYTDTPKLFYLLLLRILYFH
uniref:Uncharacterized protein n=1 Tax=Glossina austeni TaxID=7395 RepID=A0A1A9VJ94_GLOAU